MNIKYHNNIIMVLFLFYISNFYLIFIVKNNFSYNFQSIFIAFLFYISNFYFIFILIYSLYLKNKYKKIAINSFG